MLQEINKELLLSLNSLMNYEIVKKIVVLFVDFPIFFLPVFLIFTWIYYTYYKKNIPIISNPPFTKNLLEKENLLYIFYSVVIWTIISLWIQHLVHIERPEDAIKWIWILILNHIPDASFPSDHATVSIAFLTSLFFSWFKKTWLFFAPFAILMIISRVIAWVHWPFDIITWAFVWFVSSFITFKYLTKVKIINKLNQCIIKILWYIKL